MISISVDKRTLQVSLSFYSSPSAEYRKVFLLISSNTESYETDGGCIKLPWSEFNASIKDFLFYCKSENVKVNFDEFSESLIKSYISDRSFRKRETNYLSLSQTDITTILNFEDFYRSLTNEQLRDVSKLIEQRHGANFSVPGAGKTTTLLAVFKILKHYEIVDKLFVVAPKNAFISWENEVRDIFSGKISCYRITNSALKELESIPDNVQVILINYEKLRKDVKQLIHYFLQRKIHFVLDESHRIKSGKDNISFNQIDRLADISARRDILSGTPVPQSYLDIDPQFSFLWRDNIIPIDMLNTNQDISNTINQRLSRFFVRTTKAELGLPDPVINYHKVKMGPIQSEIYELLKSEIARQLSALSKDQIRYLRSLGSMTVRLMQAATNPMLLGSEDEYFGELFAIPPENSLWDSIFDYSRYEKPAKFTELQSIVDNYLNEYHENKVVIWSYFIKNIKHLEKIFEEYNPVSIYGAIYTGNEEDSNSREGRILRFHKDPSCRVLIGNPQACGEGISLHKACHHAIYLDRNFNAAYYLQSVDRIHRLGLSKDVRTQITIMVSSQTIDEVILNRLNEKTYRMGEVLNDQYLRKLALDPEDIPFDESLGLDNQDIREITNHILNNLS